MCYVHALGSCCPLLALWLTGPMPEGLFRTLIELIFVFWSHEISFSQFRFVFSSMCILSFVPYIVPRIMGSWLTDCPSDYEFMTHRLPHRLWDCVPRIVPRIMSSWPTDCPSDCEIISHGLSLGYEMHSVFRWFCFRALSGTWFLLSPRFMEIEFLVLWHLCVLSWCVRCLTPLWVPLRMTWLD